MLGSFIYFALRDLEIFDLFQLIISWNSILPTMLATTNLTNSTGTLNYVGTVLGRLCPGNSHEAVLESSKSHLNPFQLLFVACLVVSIFSMIPILIRIETWLFDLDGDGNPPCGLPSPS